MGVGDQPYVFANVEVAGPLAGSPGEAFSKGRIVQESLEVPSHLSRIVVVVEQAGIGREHLDGSAPVPGDDRTAMRHGLQDNKAKGLGNRRRV